VNYVNGLDLQSDQDAIQAQAARNRTALNASNLAADPTYCAVDGKAALDAAGQIKLGTSTITSLEPQHEEGIDPKAAQEL
jgi:hypothetical protein